MAENLFVRMGGNGGGKVFENVGSYMIFKLTHLFIKFGRNRNTALFVRSEQSSSQAGQEEWRTSSLSLPPTSSKLWPMQCHLYQLFGSHLRPQKWQIHTHPTENLAPCGVPACQLKQSSPRHQEHRGRDQPAVFSLPPFKDSTRVRSNEQASLSSATNSISSSNATLCKCCIAQWPTWFASSPGTTTS